MNKYDFVKLIRIDKNYEEYNLYLNTIGVVVEENTPKLKVLFFNEFNQGDYACIDVYKKDVELLKEQPPKNLLEYVKLNLQNFNLKEKKFKEKNFKIYQEVELLIEDEKYSKFGIHKGDIGTIIEDYAVQDSVLVDFGEIDENNNYIGDCLSVNLKDLKIKEK